MVALEGKTENSAVVRYNGNMNIGFFQVNRHEPFPLGNGVKDSCYGQHVKWQDLQELVESN